MTDIAFELKGLLKIITAPAEDDLSGVVVTTRLDDGISVTAKTKGNLMYTLPVDRKVGVQISYVDSKGNPASVDGDVRWEESDKSIFLFQVDPNSTQQMSGTIMPQGTLGQAQLRATADADLGDGVKPLITLFDLEVVGGEAVAGVITPSGDPEPMTSGVAAKKK